MVFLFNAFCRFLEHARPFWCARMFLKWHTIGNDFAFDDSNTL